MVKKQDKNLSASWRTRPPIVVVMGHVDHGKTTLLDYIRKTTLASKEAGGITQSIGAYEIEHLSASSGQVQKITFIDTPGHQAFSKMRQRGAKLADLGILIVAADESVKPQTKETIEILKDTKTPFVVAINKIDKNNSDIERTKNDLMQAGVLLEGYGGDISYQAISAKTGEGVKELLDLILFVAEVENLIYNPQSEAEGVILESEMDSRRGLAVSVVITDGTLKVGGEVATASGFGKVKILENFLCKRVNELSASSPALILGFEKAPQIGEEFWVGKTNVGQVGLPEKVQLPQVETESVINIIIKADVSGSLEALSGIIKTIQGVKIVDESIGDVNDGDVRNAINNKATIIGFRTRIAKAAKNLAKAQGIEIIASEIIYELIKKIEEAIENTKSPKASAELEILAVFGKKSVKRQIIGGRVNFGNFKNNLNVKIKRLEEIIEEGKIINLQKGKQDVKECKEGEECGMLFESSTIINVGDKLVF